MADEPTMLSPEEIAIRVAAEINKMTQAHAKAWDGLVMSLPDDDRDRLVTALSTECVGNTLTNVLVSTTVHLACAINLSPQPMLLLDVIVFALRHMTTIKHNELMEKAMADRPALLN